MRKKDEKDKSNQKLIDKLEKLNIEYQALKESARAILTQQDFSKSAKEIFSLCKKVTGATSGYVALLSSDGTENEVLFLDSGGRKCTVDENLPMPIRGLRGTAYKSKKGVFDNSFADSHWTDFLPDGHMRLDNVLFAPLIVDNKVVGLIGLANKKGGFVERDNDFVSSIGDIAAVALRNSRNLESVQYLSYHDQLTGLYNRRYFSDQIERLEGSREYPIAIISADIDALKDINDLHGHNYGDLHLQHCASVLNESVRGFDLVARVGGDEFVIVLPRTTAEEAKKTISRIQKNIDQYNKNHTTSKLSISMGASVCESSDKSLTQTYIDADNSMYEAKRMLKKGKKGN